MTLGHDKIDFLNIPTPLHRMDNLSKDLGINFYLKRDDLTDFGTGGNKLRKLEYLLRDAIDKEATMLLTVGGAQTNHGRLTAAVAAKYGMKSAIVAVDHYPGELSANLLLDGIMGCHVYLVTDDGRHSEEELLSDAVKKVKDEWESNGENVYYIPMGGSNELGILGYYDCASELSKQTDQLGLTDVQVFTTVGSMGTYMGMQTAALNKKLPLHITGINVIPNSGGIVNMARHYYGKVKRFLDLSLDIPPEEFHIIDDYHFGAYNNPVAQVRKDMYYMARREGVILDPCYTGKTFTGIVDMVKKELITPVTNVVMLHTGGLPGIYTKHHRLEMEKELKQYIHII